MRKFYSLLIVLFSFVYANAQTDFYIGNANGKNAATSFTNAYPCPVQDFYEGSRAQYLYLASELQAAGMVPGSIFAIKIQVDTLNGFSGTLPQYAISIGTTSSTSLDLTTWETGTTQVFGPVNYVPTQGINTFTFSTPFVWNGTDNIVIDICNGDPGNNTFIDYTENPSVPWSTNIGFNGSHTYRADNTGNLCGSATVTNSGTATTRPDLIFVGTNPPPCGGAPTGGTTNSSVDSICPSNSFNLTVSGASNGAGLTYEWEYSTDGTNYFPVSPAQTGKSYTVTAGISTSTYYRRKTSCGGSDAYSTPKFVYSKPFFECYCSPLTGTILHTSTNPTIDEVNVGTPTPYVNSTTGACPSGYCQFADSNNSFSLAQGVIYNLKITTSAAPGQAAAWFDWNRNGVFEPSEYLAIPVTGTGSTVDIDVPLNAQLGYTMMRVRVRAATFTTNACEQYGSGETEDYIFKVIPGTPCSGVPTGGTATASVDSICPNYPFKLSVAGASGGVTGLTYQWQMSNNCGSTWTDIAGATTKDYTIAGINATATFRRIIRCGNDSSFSSITNCIFVKPTYACICSPLVGNPLHSSITNTIEEVGVIGTTPAFSNAHPGANPAPSLGYVQFIDTSNAFALQQGGVYTLNVTTSAAPTRAGVWLDWNRNNVLDSAEFTAIPVTGTAQTVQIDVPVNASVGFSTMRVRIAGSTALNALTPCTSFFAGETEDYVFKIIPGTNCTGAPTGGATTSPVTDICPKNAFTLSVTGGTEGQTNLTYQWEKSTNGGTTWDTIGLGLATDKYYTVPTITTNTCFRRKITCLTSNQSAYASLVCVNVKPVIDCYCTPANGTVLHNGTSPSIDSVRVIGNNYNYFYSSVGLPTPPPLGYSVSPDTIYMYQASTYTLNTTTSAAATQSAVWIDWDASGSYDAATEYYPIPITNVNNTVTFTVPANATPGVTMMRVRVRGATFTNNACEQYGSGETEDYLIRIIPATPCSGNPIAGTTDVSSNVVCANVSFSLSISGAATGVYGLVYQWQDSIPGGSWSSINGKTNETYNNATQIVSKYYRRRTTCTLSGGISYSTPVRVDMLAVTYATIPFTEDFENTWIDGCGAANARSIPSNSWRNSPVYSDSSWRRDDDATAANWTNNFGNYTPNSSTGSYSARFHSYQAALGTSGNLDLYLDCSAGGPNRRLTFDFINVSGTDLLRIMLSTDGGITFTQLDTATLAASWASRTVDFVSSSATTVVRFRATADFGATDIGLDNLSFTNISAVDLAATAIVAPVGSLPATTSGTINVTIQNVGGLPIDLSTKNATVGCWVKNPNNVISPYSTVLNSSIIAPGNTLQATINNANLSVIGNYTIKCGVGIIGDANNANDSTVVGNFTTTSAVIYAVANGFWGTASTWSSNSIPTANDTVYIGAYTVTLGGTSASPYNCSSLGLGKGSNLIAPNSVLNVGPTGGGNKALTLSAGATLTISGGTINHNGMLLFGDSSNFVMSSGNLTVDGNNGTNGGSVGAANDIIGFGTNAVPYSFGNINVTGGTITIVDPHRFNANAIGYRGSITVSLGAGNTLVMGVSTSTHTTNTGANGFSINPIGASSRMSLGSVTIDGGNVKGNRFTTSTAPLGINGDLTINAGSQLRMSFQLHIAGNFVNNGIYASSTTTNFQSFATGTAAVSTNAQSISGTGRFRNNIPSVSVSAAGSGYTAGDLLTLSGGTSSFPATIYVTAVSGSGNILNATVLNMGDYYTAPTGAAIASGGTGTGATFTTTNFISPAQFTNLLVNNSNASGVSINSLGNMLVAQTGTVSGTLTLTKGIINNGNNTIILGYNATNRGTLTYTSGVITGKFSRWFTTATNATTTGDFPVGKGSIARNARVEFTTAPTKGGMLTAEFIAAAAGKGGLPLTDGALTLKYISDDGYWRIDTDSITGGTYTITVQDSGITNVGNVSTLRLVKRPTNGTNWTVVGTAGTNSGSVTKPTVVRTAVSGFSEFAIAGDAPNTLPYTSLKLTGEKVGTTNKLTWAVINEIDVRGYELQRSINAISYSTVTFVSAKLNGTNASGEYSSMDNNSITSDGYYRLKQVAKDGSVSYSNTVLIKGSKVYTITVGNVYPNPVRSNLNLVVAAANASTASIIVTDMNGKQVLKSTTALSKGDNNLQLSVQKLSAGSYTITMVDTTGNKSNVVNFVKE